MDCDMVGAGVHRCTLWTHLISWNICYWDVKSPVGTGRMPVSLCACVGVFNIVYIHLHTVPWCKRTSRWTPVLGMISYEMYTVLVSGVGVRVPEETVQNCFCQNFVKFPSILIIFGRWMAKWLKFYAVSKFFTSLMLSHCLVKHKSTRFYSFSGVKWPFPSAENVW